MRKPKYLKRPKVVREIISHEDLGLVDCCYKSRWTFSDGRVVETSIAQSLVVSAVRPGVMRMMQERQELSVWIKEDEFNRFIDRSF